MKRSEAEKHLKNRFRLDKFYDTQWSVINNLFNGERVLLIEKTGFGKSLCFQFPAIFFEGTTIVFSPLIALMRDQVQKLQALGIPAMCINSNQTDEENNAILDRAKRGEIKILYIAPERQENNSWIEATRSIKISMVVVDEAHCISVWGHDFRPSFRRIINLVKLLPAKMPVLATTATATRRVENDIAEQIGGGIKVLRGNLLRENFRLFVIKVKSEDEKLALIGQNLKKMEGTGIIYTGTRIATEIFSRWLEYLKIPSVSYNAGLDTKTRIEIEKGLLSNRWKCVISTNALGMGIDKPDIRFIIHTQIPQSPIHYYQEIGRAGRDDKPAEIILFYNPDDKSLPESFIEGGRPSINKYAQVISAVHNEPLSEKDIMRKTNLKQTQVRVIKADLAEQGIIREITLDKSKKYEYITGAPALNTKTFEELRNAKKTELEKMVEYVETKGSRMKFLCDFLGDNSEISYSNCDNTGLSPKKSIIDQATEKQLQDFRDNYFPVLEVETAKTNLVNGVAASFYGITNIGSVIHRSKYENGGDFPDFLLILALRAFRKKFGDGKFDLMVYVPPTISGDLVKNFAVKLSGTLRIPISHELIKNRITQAQKLFENGILKRDNVKDAFSFSDIKKIKGKRILLVDDIFDSGATIKEIGRYFTNLGAVKIAPLVIAKTVGGDLHD